MLLKEDNTVVAWLPDGDGFIVKHLQRFVDEVLPHYFRHKKITSFQRQLNLYGFKRESRGLGAGSYKHPMLHRDKPNLAAHMKRIDAASIMPTHDLFPGPSVPVHPLSPFQELPYHNMNPNMNREKVIDDFELSTLPSNTHPTVELADGSKAGRWTSEEHKVFMNGLERYGKDWGTISDMVKTRNVVQIRSHAQKYFKKLEKKGVAFGTIDVPTPKKFDDPTRISKRVGSRVERGYGER